MTSGYPLLGRTWRDEQGRSWFQENGRPPERLVEASEIDPTSGRVRGGTARRRISRPPIGGRRDHAE